MVDWPPTLAFLKEDAKIEEDDTRDDDALEAQLAAAVSFVERVRASTFNFDADPLSDKREPTADLALGTVRLAVRWNTRRRSPDALVNMGELGQSRVPSFDPDIDRLLGIGRFRKPATA